MWYRDQLAAFQSFFKVFTQISPFSETFGWKILVLKKPCNNKIEEKLITCQKDKKKH